MLPWLLSKEGREYRYISAMLFISRPLLFIFYAVTLSAVVYVFAFIIFTVIGTVILISQPYKKEFSVYNKVEGSMILVLGLHNGGMTLLTIADLLNRPFVIFGIVILIMVEGVWEGTTLSSKVSSVFIMSMEMNRITDHSIY